MEQPMDVKEIVDLTYSSCDFSLEAKKLMSEKVPVPTFASTSAPTTRVQHEKETGTSRSSQG
jgi:hypothetical protein